MVFPRKPRPLTNQVRIMRGYVRSLCAASSRAYREFFAATASRRDTPFEVAIRRKRIDQAIELERLGKLALKELLRQRAIALAAFGPGDQIVVTPLVCGSNQRDQRYIIVDVDARPRDRYCYRAYAVTKSGEFHRRWIENTICPSSNIRIDACDDRLSEEVCRRCGQWKKQEGERKVKVLRGGELSLLTRNIGSGRPTD